MFRLVGLSCLLALLVGRATAVSADGKEPERLTKEERARLEKEAGALNAEGGKLYQAGRYAEAVRRMEQELTLFKRLYPKEAFPDGHSDLALSLNNLGGVLESLGRADQALAYHEEALAMFKRLYPEDKYPAGHPDLALSLSNLGSVLRALGRAEQALAYHEEALAMRRRLFPEDKYPAGHPSLALSLNNHGGALRALGRAEQALPHLEEALAMCRRLFPEKEYPAGHPYLPVTLNNLGGVLEELGRADRALPYYEQALAMRRRLYPPEKYPAGHPDLGGSLNNLGGVLESLGHADQALAYHEEALAMCRRLYPPEKYPAGHPDLAVTLNNHGSVLRALGRADRALPYLEEALAMCRRLFPEKGYPASHPYLAVNLINLGSVLESLGRYDQALPRYEEALAMCRRLFPPEKCPAGHPYLAMNLNNLGSALQSLGRYDQALPRYEEALAMRRRLFPPEKCPAGHIDLAMNLNNLGSVLRALGRTDRALPHLEEALAMYGRLLDEQFLSTSEAGALDLARSLPLTLDAYLSAARQVEGSAPAAYRRVWEAKGRLTRVLEGRRLAARLVTAGPQADPKAREAWNELLGLKRRVALLQQQAGPSSKERDQLLTELIDRKEKKERELLALVPDLRRVREAGRHTPADLAKALPAKAVFVDFLRYTRFEQDPEVKGKKGERRTPSYAAFVLAAGQVPAWVELGPAEPIDAAVKAWREAITSRRDDAALAAKVRELVWQPLEERLPDGLDTVYVSPDGDLARLPFAALSGREKGSVLLEQFAVATVPHGPFLLEQLLNPRKYDGPGSVLALGGVRYGDGGPWQSLQGTAAEVDQVAAVKGRPTALTRLTGREADALRLAAELPKARYAHLATHGYFDADALAAEEKKRRDYYEKLKGYEFREGQTFGRAGGAGRRSPLGYVGLVLAGANDPAAAAAPPGALGGALMAALQPSPVFSGDRIGELPLENLRLCVLSACETGLGDLTGGEGVQGLQRAFHLAGCPNVVASLWSVNDEATAALMRRFYFHLWEKDEAPVQALRLAQLELYRNPAQVAELLRGGAPKFAGVTKPLPKGEEPKAGERAATKLWAAFVLSGVGR